MFRQFQIDLEHAFGCEALALSRIFDSVLRFEYDVFVVFVLLVILGILLFFLVFCIFLVLLIFMVL
jgi:hypothetical protein